MNSLGSSIKQCREKLQLPLQKVAAYIDIDEAALGKIEQGKRMATRKQVVELAEYFDTDENELLILWLCDKFSRQINSKK